MVTFFNAVSYAFSGFATERSVVHITVFSPLNCPSGKTERGSKELSGFSDSSETSPEISETSFPPPQETNSKQQRSVMNIFFIYFSIKIVSRETKGMMNDE